MVSISLAFPYMVMLSRHLYVNAILVDTVLLSAALGAALSQKPLLWSHNDMAVIVSWNTRGPEWEYRPGGHELSID